MYILQPRWHISMTDVIFRPSNIQYTSVNTILNISEPEDVTNVETCCSLYRMYPVWLQVGTEIYDTFWNEITNEQKGCHCHLCTLAFELAEWSLHAAARH